MTYERTVRRPDPRLPESWCREGVVHDHDACGSLWDSTSRRDIEEAARWADDQAALRRAEVHAAGLPLSSVVAAEHRIFTKVLTSGEADGGPAWNGVDHGDVILEVTDAEIDEMLTEGRATVLRIGTGGA